MKWWFFMIFDDFYVIIYIIRSVELVSISYQFCTFYYISNGNDQHWRQHKFYMKHLACNGHRSQCTICIIVTIQNANNPLFILSWGACILIIEKQAMNMAMQLAEWSFLSTQAALMLDSGRFNVQANIDKIQHLL